jgi:hypothetical protein
LSLLTNVTREPGATVTLLGETPVDVIVIVAATDPEPPSEGPVGESLPPHPAAARLSAAAAPKHASRASRRRALRIVRMVVSA